MFCLFKSLSTIEGHVTPPIRANRKCGYNKQSERWMWTERKHFGWATAAPTFDSATLHSGWFIVKRMKGKKVSENLPLLNTYSRPDSRLSNFICISLLVHHKIPCIRHYCYPYYMIRRPAFVTYCLQTLKQSFLPLSASVFLSAK